MSGERSEILKWCPWENDVMLDIQQEREVKMFVIVSMA
jgi:hypothetical protein